MEKKNNISRPHASGGGLRLHHLKIAFRNMWKFKIQTVVCVLGLSVGMACFALGTLWLRYIESFEDFVPDAENVYFVTQGDNLYRGGTEYSTSFQTGEKLMEEFSQIREFCHISCREWPMELRTEDGIVESIIYENVDTTFFRFFGIRALEGSTEHLNKGEIMLTRSVARKFFGSDLSAAIGKVLERVYSNPDAVVEKEQFTVVAVVPDCPTNTQFNYDVIISFSDSTEGLAAGYIGLYTFVKMHETAEVDSIVGKPLRVTFNEKIDINGELSDWETPFEYTLVPLRRLRTDFPPESIKISTQYVRWFMGIGLLVILCSLVNYLITMMNHLRRRAWEMSLRRVLGASIKSILAMVSTETIITFFCAAIFGWFLTWAALPFFREYSSIEIPLSEIFLSVCGYLALVIAAGSAVAAFVAWFVMKKTQANILGARQLKHSSTKLDRIGVTLQLALSMGVIFAVTIMFRQVNYLTYSDDMGFRHNDMASAIGLPEEMKQRLRQMPDIEEICEPKILLFPRMLYSTETLSDANGSEFFTISMSNISRIDVDFYGIKLISGEYPFDRPNVVENGLRWICINETMMRKLKLTPETAVGQVLCENSGTPARRVSGVIKDIYLLGPSVPPEPEVYYTNIFDWNGENYDEEDDEEDDYELIEGGFICFRTKPGMAQAVCDSITAWIVEENSRGNILSAGFSNTDAEFKKFIAAEQMLIRILLAVALCSLFVCVLGVFSLVSLSLTERRKEIAIRKAHGAHISDILQLFLKSHYLSLAIAAMIAYPLSYIIMRNWLEHYTKQVGIDWWLLPATFLLISAVVIATISAKIYFAAKEKAARALAG